MIESQKPPPCKVEEPYSLLIKHEHTFTVCSLALRCPFTQHKHILTYVKTQLLARAHARTHARTYARKRKKNRHTHRWQVQSRLVSPVSH